jgi:predicted nucleic acid-binding Zn ribbon protein
MLIYLYECRSCGREFDTLCSADCDMETVDCPSCGDCDVQNTAVIAASCSGIKTSGSAPPGRRSS